MKLDDLKNIQLTKEQQQMLVLGIVILVGGTYGYVKGLYQPRLEAIAKLSQELKKEEDLFKKIENSIKNIDESKRKAEEVVRNLRRIKRRLPEEEGVPEAMRGINKAVKMSGVTLEMFFKPPSRKGKGAKGNYAVLTTQIRIISDYRGLAAFITELMRVPRLLVCESVKLERNRDKSIPGSLKAEVGVRTYVYTASDAKGK